MKKVVAISMIYIITLLFQGCSSGSLRAMNDALSKQNGYEVTYPNQRHTSYVGDIKWVTGVRNGKGFQSITNTGDDYCKVRVKYEDDTYDYFNLDPGERTGSRYVSIYNQEDSMQTKCHSTKRVFKASF